MSEKMLEERDDSVRMTDDENMIRVVENDRLRIR
jgi:hypothetical protein